MKNLFEDYKISTDKKAVDELKEVVFTLNGVRNDVIYLHLNTFGMSFKTIHEKFNDYYEQLESDIDDIFEMIAMFSEEDECIPFNLNDSDYKSQIDKSALESSESLVESGLKLIETIIDSLEKVRKFMEEHKNDALCSDLDGLASFWLKEENYILKRFIS